MLLKNEIGYKNQVIMNEKSPIKEFQKLPEPMKLDINKTKDQPIPNSYQNYPKSLNKYDKKESKKK